MPFCSNERRFESKLSMNLENPGPGAYDDVNKSDESKRRFKPFGSGLVRFKKLKPSDMPGPG